MESTGWFLLAVVIGCVYLVAVLATLDGAIKAFRQRYLPPWVVGLATAVLLGALYAALGAPLGQGGGWLAIPCGIIAGAVYGLRMRVTPPAGRDQF